jgi:hypothetical protein
LAQFVLHFISPPPPPHTHTHTQMCLSDQPPCSMQHVTTLSPCNLEPDDEPYNFFNKISIHLQYHTLTRWINFSIYLIVLAALDPGVHTGSNRNEYQKQKNNVSGE